jgi:hypothetical protein
LVKLYKENDIGLSIVYDLKKQKEIVYEETPSERRTGQQALLPRQYQLANPDNKL